MQADRIELVVLLRNPIAVWQSWQKYWQGRCDPEIFAAAWRSCLACLKTARSYGVHAQFLQQENFSNAPLLEMTALFDSLHLRFPSDALDLWSHKPGFGMRGSGVYLPDEPHDFITLGAHDQLIDATGVFPVLPCNDLDTAEYHLLKRAGVFDSYKTLSLELAHHADN
ncbi:MAG: hypothetical protein ABJQ70_04770 [Roseobacter sp.]